MEFDLLPHEEPESIGIYDRNCVLIMDENRSALDYLASCFEQQNFKVISHTSGAFGWKAAIQSPPDCILLSTQLLDGCGIEMCHRIVDDSHTCGIPVILMGCQPGPRMIQDAKAAGCHFFLAKPIDARSIVFLVNEAIAESRSWICD